MQSKNSLRQWLLWKIKHFFHSNHCVVNREKRIPRHCCGIRLKLWWSTPSFNVPLRFCGINVNVRAEAQWSLRPWFESHCGTWVPVLRMRPYKPRSRVAVGVGTKKNPHCWKPWVLSIGLNLQPCHRQWWQPLECWKIAQAATNKQTNGLQLLLISSFELVKI
jgi:hypothetical protein